MRAKQPTLIITFSTTAAAMRMEQFCGEEGLPGRLIPVPREITAGCGLAWKAEPEQEEAVLSALRAAGIEYSGVYRLEI